MESSRIVELEKRNVELEACNAELMKKLKHLQEEINVNRGSSRALTTSACSVIRWITTACGDACSWSLRKTWWILRTIYWYWSRTSWIILVVLVLSGLMGNFDEVKFVLSVATFIVFLLQLLHEIAVVGPLALFLGRKA